MNKNNLIKKFNNTDNNNNINLNSLNKRGSLEEF